ncbi:hypothetical protein ACRALDRAFT_1065586 [Sodiomyces alcalophilus JCM 7366]|uniref:uncharacterized protein n=1 Tax=Sodiomyces alcalophilus JCM 7366 TaxID=591952 RepID=UPI0039B67B77
MSNFSVSTLDVPDSIRGIDPIGVGLTSWAFRLNAVAKCYHEDDARAREVAVYERLRVDTDWHQHIMRYYGVLENRCVVLQFACNGSIRHYLKKSSNQGGPSIAIKISWVEQVTSALAFLHSKNVIHCDISCNNIFLDENLSVLLGDFSGSSIDGNESLSWYETSHSHPDLTDPSVMNDIFALGSTFYEILSGQPPFKGLGEAAIQESIRGGSFPDLGYLPALQTVILKCWNQQYETVAELLQDVKKEGKVCRIIRMRANQSMTGAIHQGYRGGISGNHQVVSLSPT